MEVSGDELAALFASITSGARKLNRGATAGENRLNVSITVRMRSFDPVASWSWTKSIAHTSFEHAAVQRNSR